jgi:hypothetical protein
MTSPSDAGCTEVEISTPDAPATGGPGAMGRRDHTLDAAGA